MVYNLYELFQWFTYRKNTVRARFCFLSFSAPKTTPALAPGFF
jgi:hypothetical protein